MVKHIESLRTNQTSNHHVHINLLITAKPWWAGPESNHNSRPGGISSQHSFLACFVLRLKIFPETHRPHTLQIHRTWNSRTRRSVSFREAMTKWNIRSGEVYQRLLSALERATGKRTNIQISDSSAKTKRDDAVAEFEAIEDVNSVPPVATAPSSVRLAAAPSP